MSNTFEIGAVVQLKSGGPKMTVTSEIDNRDKIWCSWFADAKSETSYFPVEALIPVSDREDKSKFE